MPSASGLEYPPADRDDVIETLHGVRVADPYRYLEDPDADRTTAFVAAQNAVSGPYLAGLVAAAVVPRGGHRTAHRHPAGGVHGNAGAGTSGW